MNIRNKSKIAAAVGVALMASLPAVEASAFGGLLPRGGNSCSFTPSSQTVYVDANNLPTPPNTPPSPPLSWFRAGWLEDSSNFNPSSVPYAVSLTGIGPDPAVQISFSAGGTLYGPIDVDESVYEPDFYEEGPTENPGDFLLRALDVMLGGFDTGIYNLPAAQIFAGTIVNWTSYPLTFTVEIGETGGSFEALCSYSITYVIDYSDFSWDFDIDLSDYLPEQPAITSPLPDTL